MILLLSRTRIAILLSLVLLSLSLYKTSILGRGQIEQDSDLNVINISEELSVWYVIDESGEYSIANDYIDLGYDIGILINADNVILDGTGHMMDSSGAGYAIYVNNSRNITIKNFVLSNWSTGIKLEIAYNTSIENVDISNCTKGIDIYASYMIYVKDTGVMQNTYGIYTEIDCSALEITNCDIEKNIYGIYLSDAASSIIASNMIGYNEEYGVYLLDDNGVHVYCNNIINNSYGIKQEFSRYNYVYINNIINNTQSYVEKNTYNITYCSPHALRYKYGGVIYRSKLGNFWDDYNGTDQNADGIGDSSYYGIDEYPLVEKIENYNIMWPPKIIKYSPFAKLIEKTAGEKVVFKIKADQKVTIKWLKNNETIQTKENVKEDTLIITVGEGQLNITVIILNANGTDNFTWTIIGRPATSPSHFIIGNIDNIIIIGVIIIVIIICVVIILEKRKS